jgi:hypothetical protein
MNLASWIFEHMVLLDGQKIVDHDNGRSGRAAKATLVAKPAEQLFQWTKDMTTDSLMMPFEWKPTSIDHFLAMANGQAAMGIESSSALATVMLLIGGGTVQDTGGLDPDALGAGGIDPEGMDIGVAPLPVIATGDGGYQAGGAAAFVASNSSPAERVASWDFISFMSQPAEQAKWHIASSFTPMSSDSAQLPELTSYWETTPDQKLSWDMYQTNGEGEASGPVIGPYDEVREAIAAAWFRAATGDPKAELQTAETEVNELLADYADRVGYRPRCLPLVTDLQRARWEPPSGSLNLDRRLSRWNPAVALPQGFVQDHSNGICEVQRPVTRSHRNRQLLVDPSVCQDAARQAVGFPAEHQHVAGRKVKVPDVGICLRCRCQQSSGWGVRTSGQNWQIFGRVHGSWHSTAGAIRSHQLAGCLARSAAPEVVEGIPQGDVGK